MTTTNPGKESPTVFANKIEALRHQVAEFEKSIKDQQEKLFDTRQELSRELMRSIRREDDSPSP